MSKTIKYTGIQDRWPELPFTGKQSVWRIGQQEERPDDQAAMLLNTGLFAQVQKLVGPLESVGAIITGSGLVGEPLTATLPAGVIGTLQFTKTLLATPFTKSNIAGAVANAVNSLQYTPSQDDIPYRIGCDASNTVAPSAGVTISAPPVVPTLRAISDRVYLNEFRSGSFKSLGGKRTVKLADAVTALEMTFFNWVVKGYANGSPTYLEEGSGGPADWWCAVEYPAGVFNQALVDGSPKGTTPDGGQVTLRATFNAPAGAEVVIHCLQFQTGAGFCVMTGLGSSAAAPTVTSTAAKDILRGSAAGIVNATMTGNWAAAGGNDLTGNAFGPNVVAALTTKPAALVLGTSIELGVGGTQASVFNSGLICQQLSDAGIGFTNGGIQSDSLRRFLLSNSKRVALGNSSLFSTIIFGGPVNDVSSNSPVKTAAEMFADLRAVWALFPGKNKAQQTMTPMTDAGNSPIAKLQIWRDLNDMIRTNTDGVKVIEVAGAMCNGGRDSCVWYSGDTVDGTHPGNQGYNRMRASNALNLADIR